MSDGKKSRTVVPRKVGVWIGGKGQEGSLWMIFALYLDRALGSKKCKLHICHELSVSVHLRFVYFLVCNFNPRENKEP